MTTFSPSSTTNTAGSPDLSFGNTQPKDGTVLFTDLEGISGLLKDGSTVTAAPLTLNGSYYIGLTKHDVHGAQSYKPVLSGSTESIQLLALTVQEDDKAVVLAFFKKDRKTFIARFNPTGEIDAEFGPGGSKRLDATAYEGLNSNYGLAVQADNKIIAAFNTDVADSAIWRLESDGQLDLGFGERGQIKLPHTYLRDLIVTNNGFVISGMKDDQAIIAGYLANGQVDPNFGVDGLATLTLEQNHDKRAIALALTQHSDHKITVIGTGYTTPHAFNFITRLLPNGELDPQFNSGKPLETDTTHDAYTSVVTQRDNKVVVLTRNSIGSLVQLVRYLPDGRLDVGFGVDGVAQAYRDPQGRPEIAHVNKLELLLPDEKLQSSGSPRGASYIGRLLSR